MTAIQPDTKLERKRRYINGLAYLALIAFCILEFVVLRQKTTGNFFNSYPLIGSDGFDWIYQGAFILEKILGNPAASDVHYLRQPVFVLIGALDAALSSTGTIYILQMALTTFFSEVLLFRILRLMGVSWSLSLWAAVVFLINPLSFFRAWAVVDPLASTLMLASTLALLKYRNTGSSMQLVLAAATAVVGGWTQLYGVIPFMVGVSIDIAVRLYRGEPFSRQILTAIASGLICIVGLGLWYGLIPHLFTPTQFGMIHFDLGMWDFYSAAWLLFLGPLFPIVLYLLWLLVLRDFAARDVSINLLIILSIVLLFEFLTFFYHAEDSRFTFMFYGYVIILCTAILSVSNARHRVAGSLAVAASSILFVFSSFVLVPPADHWRPRLREFRVDSSRSWLLNIVRAKPQDRFRLSENCGNLRRICADTPVVSAGDIYLDLIFPRYRNLMSDHTRRSR